MIKTCSICKNAFDDNFIKFLPVIQVSAEENLAKRLSAKSEATEQKEACMSCWSSSMKKLESDTLVAMLASMLVEIEKLQNKVHVLRQDMYKYKPLVEQDPPPRYSQPYVSCGSSPEKPPHIWHTSDKTTDSFRTVID